MARDGTEEGAGRHGAPPVAVVDASDPGIGRFDQSFLIVMIRDFFLILILVSVVEFSLKAGLVWWDFQVNGEAEARAVAEDVAGDVRSIMLNEGGPVAARTLYPIVRERLEALGWYVELAPAEITVDAIEQGFGFTPMGIAVGERPDGAFRAARIEIEAEAFCQSCHVTAEIGDVLGTVEARTYLSSELALWWEDVRLTAGISVGKIALHSILLFLLLRARLEPLMRLRAVVSRLARAFGGLDARAEIRSRDEFGVLSRDLNLFLDRVAKLMGELDGVLRRIIQVNDDVVGLQSELREGVDAFVRKTRDLERNALRGARREPRLSAEWFAAMKGSVTRLGDAAPDVEAAAVVEELRAVIAAAEGQLAVNETLFDDLVRLGEDSERFQTALAEMARLEERLRGVIASGGELVGRLRPAE